MKSNFWKADRCLTNFVCVKGKQFENSWTRVIGKGYCEWQVGYSPKRVSGSEMGEGNPQATRQYKKFFCDPPYGVFYHLFGCLKPNFVPQTKVDYYHTQPMLTRKHFIIRPEGQQSLRREVGSFRNYFVICCLYLLFLIIILHKYP